MTNIEKLENRFAEVVALAVGTFEVNLDKLHVVFDIKGNSTLGEARLTRETGEMSVRLNAQAVEHYFDELYDNTIPHEVAHIVDFVMCAHKSKSKSNNGHNSVWKMYCTALGGDATRVAEGDFSKLKPARKMRMWLYKDVVTGELHELTTVRHNKLQKGKVDWYDVQGGGRITQQSFIEEVV